MFNLLVGFVVGFGFVSSDRRQLVDRAKPCDPADEPDAANGEHAVKNEGASAIGIREADQVSARPIATTPPPTTAVHQALSRALTRSPRSARCPPAPNRKPQPQKRVRGGLSFPQRVHVIGPGVATCQSPPTRMPTFIVRPTYRRSAAGARGSEATDKPVCCNAGTLGSGNCASSVTDTCGA